VCTTDIFTYGGGVCRPACAPQIGADAGCPAGDECIAGRARPTEGVCLPRGPFANGESCNYSGLPFSTMCSQPDSFCASSAGGCTQLCAMFGEGTAPACPAGQFCRTTYGGTYCGGNEFVSAAQVGQPCGPDYYLGCAPGGGRLNGLCVYDGVGDHICRPICKLGGPPCAAGTCVNKIDGYVGACVP
ncbi:MAG TPA: hypothetical protein VFS00_25910, partial [Polyangiaceae bacterium]|nr:hypothetical protein [Polyangiaceae bacterium]